MSRIFRTEESYIAERATRSLVAPFLAERGFSQIRNERQAHGVSESQTVFALSPEQQEMAIRVRVCWRRRKPSETVSAAQLMAKIKNSGWESSIQEKIDREITEGITHTLFIQRENVDFVSHAALIPQAQMLNVWCVQRDAFKRLLDTGMLGKKKKNPSENGKSPTYYLYDESAPQAIAALWNNPGVVNLVELKVIEPSPSVVQDDTYDDLPGVDYSLIGSDDGQLTKRTQSHVKRDPRVRKEVIKRAGGRCENLDCGVCREYPGFLDVHHILGVGKSDRVWNCVALCPNCHRETHASPEHKAVNENLLSYVNRFKAKSES
jgi:5-methylcytosine-specific restriction protein A